MLGSHTDQWEARVAAWRFVHSLVIVEGGKTADARGSSSSPSRPRKAPRCVWREFVLSVYLRFHSFCAWQNRNCQREYCLDRDIFFKSKAKHVFQRSRPNGTGFHLIVSKKMRLFSGQFCLGRRFDWRSMVMYRFVMTWIKILLSKRSMYRSFSFFFLSKDRGKTKQKPSNAKKTSTSRSTHFQRLKTIKRIIFGQAFKETLLEWILGGLTGFC